MEYKKMICKELAEKVADMIYNEILCKNEIRDVNMTLYTKPSIKRKLKEEARKEETSVNNLLNTILEERYNKHI